MQLSVKDVADNAAVVHIAGISIFRILRITDLLPISSVRHVWKSMS